MTLVERIILVALILIIDFCFLFVPLTAILVAVIILARPKWVLKFIDKLYSVENS